MIGLWLSILLFTIGCFLSKGGPYSDSTMPTRMVDLKIDETQREFFFEQMQKFADEHDSRLVLTEYKMNNSFSVEIWGDDTLITANDVPPDATLVYVFFYWINFGTPVDEDAIDDLLEELVSLIIEIPNVTITEEK